MPWCEPCGRFYSPNTLTPEGFCPNEHLVADQPGGDDAAPGGASPQPATAPRNKVPWHFWVLLAALSVYLVWRFIQLIGWIIN